MTAANKAAKAHRASVDLQIRVRDCGPELLQALIGLIEETERRDTAAISKGDTQVSCAIHAARLIRDRAEGRDV